MDRISRFYDLENTLNVFPVKCLKATACCELELHYTTLTTSIPGPSPWAYPGLVPGAFVKNALNSLKENNTNPFSAPSAGYWEAGKRDARAGMTEMPVIFNPTRLTDALSQHTCP